MPLPKPVAREELHNRTIEMKGYRREDGLFDMEGRITDIKAHPFQPSGGRYVEPGTTLHDMWVRLVIDEDLVVREVHAVTDAHPFPECPGAAPGLSVLKGVLLSRGWLRDQGEVWNVELSSLTWRPVFRFRPGARGYRRANRSGCHSPLQSVAGEAIHPIGGGLLIDAQRMDQK